MIEGLDTRENCYILELKTRGSLSERQLRKRFEGKPGFIKETLNKLVKKGYIRRYQVHGINNWEVDHV